MNSSSTSLLFIFATVIVVLVAPAIAEDIKKCTDTADYCWSCSGGSNTTSNATTTYTQNLNTLLLSLSSVNETNYGFLNMSKGTGTDKVNLMAICRGDLAVTECRSCYSEANMYLSQNCTNQHQAIIWAVGCTVRYSNVTIFGIEEDEPVIELLSPNPVSNPADFKMVLNPLLKTLVQNASSGDSMKKFAAGHAPVPAGSATNQTIYATVQCSPELDKQKCSKCLEDSIEEIPTCCEGKDGARILKPSCNLRFEKGMFYKPAGDSLVNISTATTPSPTATPTPSPTATPTPTTPAPTTPTPTTPAPTTPTTEGNNTSNLTIKVSPASFFQMLLLVSCLSSALALF